MTEPSAPQGFSGGQSFQYDGKLDSVPDWVDKGWATYDRGPALAVPRGNPNKGPYNTVVARLGDYIFANEKGDRFTVVRAEEIGEQPGDPSLKATKDRPLPAKPVGTEYASLEDLDANGILPYDEMNPEQQGQMVARGTAPEEAMQEAAGNAPVEEPAPTSSRRRRQTSEE